MDVGTAWPEVAGNGELDGRTGMVDLEHLLHGAFAKRTFARNQRSAMILQASRHDFAGAGRLVVLQNDHRYVCRQFDLAVGCLGMIETGSPSFGRHDTAFAQQHVAHIHRSAQNSTRIESQIDDQRFGLRLDGLEHLPEFIGSPLTEQRDADVSDVGIFCRK